METIATLLIVAALPLFSILAYFFGAESRPQFLDLRIRPRRWI